MRKITVLAIGLLLCSVAIAQEFSYKHERDLILTKVKRVVVSDLEAPSAKVTHMVNEAPEPWGAMTELKKTLDANRSRRFPLRLDKYKETPEDIKPDVKASFEGLTNFTVPGIPNDNNMAISDSGIIMSVANSTASILNENGTFERLFGLETIVDGQLPNLNRVYDPKVAYDPDNDRFILVFLQGTSSPDTRIIVGFSETNNPHNAWNFYAIDGNPFAPNTTWSDYPIIGLSKDDLFITVNILRDGESWQEGFTQSIIWQIDKASGFEGKDTVYQDLWHDLNYNGKPLWSICAVQGGSAFTSPNMHFLSVRPGDASNDSVFLHEITDTRMSGNATYNLNVLTADKKYGVPPSAFQPDPENLLQTNDTRVLSAIEHDGYIQYVQSTMIHEKNSPGIFHGLLDLSNLNINASYIESDSFDYAYPSITYVGNDEYPFASVITFSHSSELVFPGTSVAFYNKNQGEEGIISSVVRIKDGEHSINRLGDSLERWGDYTGIQTRYNRDGEVWFSGSFGRPYAPGSPRGRNGIWIGSVTVDRTLTTLPKKKEVMLLPNPALEKAIVRFTAEESEELNFNLYSMEGKLVGELLTAMVEVGRNEFEFSTTNLAQGYYVLRILNANEDLVASLKIMKL